MAKKKTKQISKPDKTIANADPNKQHKKLEIWKLVVGSFVAILAVLIPLLWNALKSEPPRFALRNPITQPDSGLIFVALNDAADQNRALDVEFDSKLFTGAGKLLEGHNPRRWHFSFSGRGFPQGALDDGDHDVRVGFAGSFSDTLTVLFNRKAPVAHVEIKQTPGNLLDRTISGKVDSQLQAPAETLAVDVFFHHEGQPVQIPLPVKRITDEAIGLTYFEFSTAIQNLPKIQSDDQRYAEPFFAFRVKDQAGNQYYHVESYAQFVAPGDKRFGVNSLADIEVTRLPEDVRKQRVAFRFVPKQAPLTHLVSGEPAIRLKVTSIAQNINWLGWTDLPKERRASQPITLVFRNQKQLTVAFGNAYIDENAPGDAAYHVEQAGRDGRVYRSNTAAPEQPAETDKPVFLTEADAKRMLKEKNLFDSVWNQ